MHEIKNDLSVLKDMTISAYKTKYDDLTESEKELITEILDSYSDKLIKVIMKNLKNATTKEDMISITKTLRNTFTLEVGDDIDSGMKGHPHMMNNPHMSENPEKKGHPDMTSHPHKAMF